MPCDNEEAEVEAYVLSFALAFGWQGVHFSLGRKLSSRPSKMIAKFH